MTEITHDATTITPTQVLGYKTIRASRNLLHPIIGRPDVDVTLRPAALRSGTLSLGFADRAEAWAAVGIHALPGRFTLIDPAVPEVDMTYVVAGPIAPELEDQSRELWIVSIDYQEVIA